MAEPEKSRRDVSRMSLVALTGVVCVGLLLTSNTAMSQQAQRWPCGHFTDSNGPGPLDIRDRSEDTLKMRHLVEAHHFTANQQRLAFTGKSRGPYDALEYTLRAIPNHHQALFLMGVLQHKLREYDPDDFRVLQTKKGNYRPTSCWFQRAIQFKPQDVGIYNAQGRVLHMMGKHKEAIEAFKQVIKLAPKSPHGHYNLGLAYYSAGQYKASASSARRAMQLGHTRTELRRRLKRKGFWGE